MTKQVPFYYDMPEGVKAALLRLQSACRRDGVHSISIRYSDDEGMCAWVRKNRREQMRFVVLINRDFYEHRSVDE